MVHSALCLVWISSLRTVLFLPELCFNCRARFGYVMDRLQRGVSPMGEPQVAVASRSAA